MSEEKKMIINEKDFVACNYFEACDYFKQLKRLQKENEKLKEVTNEAIIEHENLLINRNDFAERAYKYRLALEEIRDLFDAIAYRKLQTFNEIDTGKILLAMRKRVNEVLNDRD